EINRKMNAEYLEKLKEKMEVTILTPEQKAAFQQACQPIYDQFAKDIGEDLIKEVQKLTSEYKK
ncbi:MAG: C4-dicarboxylate ABC transporter substrate-binding protein, partial [Synergistaceae bacterium]|nr:C4-dicarboxylate ABC transporter substrate-binding protein [Synergistaceae bacterium]